MELMYSILKSYRQPLDTDSLICSLIQFQNFITHNFTAVTWKSYETVQVLATCCSTGADINWLGLRGFMFISQGLYSSPSCYSNPISTSHCSLLPAVPSPICLDTNQLKAVHRPAGMRALPFGEVRQIALWAACCASLPESAGKQSEQQTSY